LNPIEVVCFLSYKIVYSAQA